MSLSTLYDEIVAKAKVDHSSKEIQDISSAVEEMLKRLVSGEIEIEYEELLRSTINTIMLKFRGADLQQCGSMHEKTSLWKSSRRQGRENKFLEYDYLVILHNEDNEVRIETVACQGCRGVVPGESRGRAGKQLGARYFNSAFLEALYSRIDRMCSCRVDPDHTLSEDNRHDSRPPCSKCTVARDTGRLQIAKIPDIYQWNQWDVKQTEGCSLVCYWTSCTHSLLVPNIETLQTTERIGRLVIRVDILPGFEYPGDKDGDECGKKRFIIAKTCPYNCLRSFMVSYCMHELRALKHVSDQHKQCFIIIKFLYGQFIYWTGLDVLTNSYHAKVAFLTHCQTCTDEQNDCTTCITEILRSLEEAYRSGSLRLPEFHPVEILSFSKINAMKAIQTPIFSLLHVLSQLKSPNENHQCNSQYRPCHTVGIIKRTCRMLFEQGKTDLNYVDGRPFENTVSTEDILCELLSHKEFCYSVIYLPYDDNLMKILCHHRLDCPKPERVLLWWRAVCMFKMILASDITHIRDETIKKLEEDVQNNAILAGYKRRLFLTSSQSVTEMPKNDLETSSLTPSLDGRCNDTTGLSVPTDSIFTDDLQLNWSALNVTEQQIEKFRRLAEEKRKEKRERSFPPPITPPGLSTEIPMYQPIVPGLFSDGMPEIQFEEVRPALNAPFHGLLTSSTVRSFSQNKHNNYPPSGTLMNIPAVPTTGIVTGGQTMEFNPYIPFQEYHLPIDSQQTPMLPSRIPQGSMVPGLPGIPCQGMPEVPGGFPRMMSTGVRPPVQELLLEGVGARIPCLPISSTTRSFQRNVKNNTQPPESFLDNQAAYRPGFVPQERLMEFNPNIPPPGYHLPFGSLQRPMIPCMMPPGIQMQQPRIQSIPVTSLEWMPVMPGESSQMMNSGVMLPIQVPFTVVGQGVGARIPVLPISSTTRSFQRNVKNNTQLPGSFLDNQAAYRPGFVPQERIMDFNPNIPPPGYHPPFGSLQPPAIPCMMPPGIQMQQPMIQSIPVTSSDDDLRCDAANPSTVYSSWTSLDLFPKSLKPISTSEQVLIPDSEEDINQMCREEQIAETTPTETNTNLPTITTEQCITDLEVTVQHVIAKPTTTDREKLTVRKPQNIYHSTMEEVASKKTTEVTSKRRCATELTATPSTSSSITRNVEIARAMIEDTDQEDSDE